MTVSDGSRVPVEPRRDSACVEGVEESANGRSNDAGRQRSNQQAPRTGHDVDAVPDSEGRWHHHDARGEVNAGTVSGMSAHTVPASVRSEVVT